MFDETKDILRTQGVKAKGYGIIPKLVMQDKRLSIEAKSIYSYFCSYAGAGDTAFPSVRKICFDFGVSEDRFRKHLKILIEYGYITVEQKKLKGRYASNIYTLIDRPQEVNTPKTPYTENQGTVKQCTEDTFYKINKNKNNSIENQSVSQSLINTTETDGQTDGTAQSEIETIVNNARVETYDSEDLRETLKEVISQAYHDKSTRPTIKRLKLEHIDIAKAIYIEQQEAHEIKKPLEYFRKCLLSAIQESGLKGLF
jgi:DNA-binding transcriptional regulator YhcF (GntR family)